jgi:hypothetical protein
VVSRGCEKFKVGGTSSRTTVESREAFQLQEWRKKAALGGGSARARDTNRSHGAVRVGGGRKSAKAGSGPKKKKRKKKKKREKERKGWEEASNCGWIGEWFGKWEEENGRGGVGERKSEMRRWTKEHARSEDPWGKKKNNTRVLCGLRFEVVSVPVVAGGWWLTG